MEEFTLSRNSRLWESCNFVRIKQDDPNLCFNATFYNDLCQMYPIRLTKVVRGSVKELTSLLSHVEALGRNLKIIFLARDPRAISSSRSKLDWCDSDCKDVNSLCQALDENFDTIQSLAWEFPSQVYFLRYEDLCLEPETHVTSLFSFLGHPVTAPIKRYVVLHMSTSDPDQYATRRMSKSRVFQWIKDLPLTNIRAIEKSCRNFMEKAGYRDVEDYPVTQAEVAGLLAPDHTVWNYSRSSENWFLI